MEGCFLVDMYVGYVCRSRHVLFLCMCCVCAVYVLCMCCVCAVPVYVLCMCRACVCAVPVYVLCLFMCCACVYAAPCICCACTRTHRHRDAVARARARSLSLTLARAHTRHKLGTKLVRCTTKTKTVVHRKRKLLTLTCIFASIAYRDARAVRAHYRHTKLGRRQRQNILERDIRSVSPPPMRSGHPPHAPIPHSHPSPALLGRRLRLRERRA